MTVELAGMILTVDAASRRVVAAVPTSGSNAVIFDLYQAGLLEPKFGGSKTYGHVSYYLPEGR